MASPVFHGLAGAGLAYAMTGNASFPFSACLRKAGKWMVLGAILACLPDIDYLPGLWRGDLNLVHQQGTHSLAWVVLVSAGLWLAGRAWRPALFGKRALGFILILAGSHLAIDLVTQDLRAPYGFPLWAPVSAAPVHAPFSVLPAWE